MIDPSGADLAHCPYRNDGACRRSLGDAMREIASQPQDNIKPRAIADELRRIDASLTAGEFDCRAAGGLPCLYPPATPRFDAERRELFVGDVRLHCFAAQAYNETMILASFEARSWPRRLYEPLGKVKASNGRYGGWLKTAIYRLNQCQQPCLIRFHSYPSDRAAGWEWRSE